MRYGLYCDKERYHRNINGFDGAGKWYKGNLHTHTTRSDGVFSPENVIEFYRHFGYDFIGITDHHVYTNAPKLTSESFVVLPGVEFDASRVKNLDREGRPSNIGYHENAILWDFDNPRRLRDGYRETYGDVFPEGTTLKEGISLFNEKYQSFGNMNILNHPVWSRQTCADAYGLRGIFAMEIYNHSSEAENKTGLAVTHWDYCLRRGQRLFGVATDDFHFGLEPKGYIMVKAESLTQRSVAKAIREGRFYASNGPEIYEYYLEGHTVMLKCSPVKTIRFIKYEPMGNAFHAENGGYLTQAETGVNGTEKYVRAEIIDEHGYTAWTNPIFLHDDTEEK